MTLLKQASMQEVQKSLNIIEGGDLGEHEKGKSIGCWTECLFHLLIHVLGYVNIFNTLILFVGTQLKG